MQQYKQHSTGNTIDNGSTSNIQLSTHALINSVGKEIDELWAVGVLYPEMRANDTKGCWLLAVVLLLYLIPDT